jgi:hypothetical protein
MQQTRIFTCDFPSRCIGVQNRVNIRLANLHDEIPVSKEVVELED